MTGMQMFGLVSGTITKVVALSVEHAWRDIGSVTFETHHVVCVNLDMRTMVSPML